jgi:methionine-rich copper-binding protein CopC
MKKLSHIALMLLFVVFTSVQLSASPVTVPNEPASPTSNNEAIVEAMVVRLNEIKDMDKSTLNSSEKKELRKEVKSIKASLKEKSSGVYLSVGAVIIIVLLLILLL